MVPVLRLGIAASLLSRAALSKNPTPKGAAGPKSQECPADAWCGDDEGYAWSTKHGDVRGSGTSSLVGPWDISGGPVWTWKNESGTSVIRASPLIDHKSNVYLTTAPGTVIKFNKFGQVMWHWYSGGIIPDTPVLSQGKIYGNNQHGEVWALDMESGKEVYKKRILDTLRFDAGGVTICEGVLLSKAIKPSPFTGYDEVYSLGGAPRIVAADVATGNITWEYHFDANLFNAMPLCVGDGTLLISDSEGGVYRLLLKNGDRVWKVNGVPSANLDVGNTMGSIALGPNNMVYTPGNRLRGGHTPEGYLRAHRLEDGELVWEQRLGHPVHSTPAVANLSDGLPSIPRAEGSGGLVVFIGLGHGPPAPDGRPRHEHMSFASGFAAFNAMTGAPMTYMEGPHWQGPAAGEEESVGGRTHFLGPALKTCAPAGWTGPAVGGDGVTYVGSHSGWIYALKDADWNGMIDVTNPSEVIGFDSHMAVAATPAIGNGFLAVPTCEMLLVFK